MATKGKSRPLCIGRKIFTENEVAFSGKYKIGRPPET